MKTKLLTVLLFFLLISPLFIDHNLIANASTANTPPNIFLGVDVSFESVSATEQLIDKVCSYTNLFVIGCYGNYNLTRLNILSQYVYDRGLSFIVYTDSSRYPSRPWLADAKNTYGDKFLGIYYLDELGGKQLDQASYPLVTNATSFNDAATNYVYIANFLLRNGTYGISRSFAYPHEFKLFTSDYSLYWYDYEAGYDTVFAEFTMNFSQQLNLDLVRGAAASQNKDWGVMITWKYNTAPYMESGPELLADMKLAYQNGAKYIIVFDGDQNWTQNILDNGQLDAIKEFWQYAQITPQNISPASDRTAYVLPVDYAYGFRGPSDRIWGLWSPDSITDGICRNVSKLIQKYGYNLDIVYPNGTYPVESLGYKNVFYWNDPRLADSSVISVTASSTDPQKGFSLLEMYIFSGTAIILAIFAVAFMFHKFKKF
jgi:hypothetical protein